MSVRQSLNVALEGPCCAGKTTLGHCLLDDPPGFTIAYVHDYAEHAGGGEFLPSPEPVSLAEEERALNQFLHIEADRTKHLHFSPTDVTLIDRSVHSLLSHCSALDKLNNLGFSSLAARVVIQSRVPLWPDLVLYLDISHEAVMERNKGKFGMKSIFINPFFNDGIRSYFRSLADSGVPQVMWLDATLSLQRLRQLAGNRIRELLQS